MHERNNFCCCICFDDLLVIAGIALYPDVLGRAATNNNDLVFAFFLGPFCVLPFFAWVGEKVVLKVLRRKG